MSSIVSCIAVSTVLALSTAAQTQPTTQTMKFRRIGVNDPRINNIEAVSFLVPAGQRTGARSPLNS